MKINVSKLKLCLMCVLLVVAVMANIVVISYAAGTTVPDGQENGAPEGWDLDQIVLDKSVSLNEKTSPSDVQTYKLHLDAYVKGEVVWEETKSETPQDIVLVLDVSASMDDRMSASDRTTRLAALKTAVNKFIEDMSGKNNKEKPYERYKIGDHRMSIVTFAGSSSKKTKIANYWTPLNADGVTALESTVSGISTDYYTATDKGLSLANDLMKDKTDGGYYDLTDTNIKEGRKKAVILFTDGVPTNNSTALDQSVADNAVKQASILKKAGVTVFTVGIFDNAKSDELWPKSNVYNMTTCATSKGAVNEYWEHTNVTTTDYPAANRMMNLISSNYADAKDVPTSLGLTKSQRTSNRTTYYKYTINTATPTRSKDDFYFTAKTSDELSYQFIRISQWIAYGGTSVELNERSVVRDIVSEYFQIPAYVTKDDIITYYAACTGVDAEGKFTFDERKPTKGSELFADVSVEILDFVEESDKRDIRITGFDFTDNFVAYDPEAKKAHGYKLVIEFDIQCIDNFNGGNNVPTNGPESGIYREGDDEPLVPFNKPTVDIEIPAPTGKVLADSVTIYQGNTVPVERLLEVIDVEDPINDAYINRVVKVNGVEVKDGIFDPEHTTLYPKNSVEITLTPKYDPSGIGTEAKEVKGTNLEDFTIYVAEPTVTVEMKDVKDFYGNTYTLGDDAFTTWDVTWKVPNVTPEPEISDGFEAPFDADDIYVDYSSTGFAGTVTKKDITVSAEALFNEGVYEDSTVKPADKATVVYKTTCAYGCTSPRYDGTYLVHSDTASLTVSNVGGTDEDIFKYVILKDGVKYMTVTVPGGETENSVTITGLPAGEYSVEVADGCSWRYSHEFTDSTDTVTLDADNPADEIGVVYTDNEDPLLGSVSALVKNVYDGEDD